MVRRLGMAYFAGAIGALASSLALWIAGRAALTGMIGVSLAPELGVAWLSTRVLQGSLWALLYPWVLSRGLRPVRAGLALSLLPGAVELFHTLPRNGHELLGVDLGPLTPLVVLAGHAIWGWGLARVMIAAGVAGAAGRKE